MKVKNIGYIITPERDETRSEPKFFLLFLEKYKDRLKHKDGASIDKLLDSTREAYETYLKSRDQFDFWYNQAVEDVISGHVVVDIDGDELEIYSATYGERPVIALLIPNDKVKYCLVHVLQDLMY